MVSSSEKREKGHIVMLNTRQDSVEWRKPTSDLKHREATKTGCFCSRILVG